MTEHDAIAETVQAYLDAIEPLLVAIENAAAEEDADAVEPCTCPASEAGDAFCQCACLTGGIHDMAGTPEGAAAAAAMNARLRMA